MVVGSANADLVVPVERRPAGGETVLGGELGVHPGGKGANQAVAAARLGGDVHFIGCVGTDSYGEMLRASLGDSGVATAHLRTSPKHTGVALITVTPDGENSILVAPGANGELAPRDLDTAMDLLAPGTVIVTQLEIPQEVVDRVADLAGHTQARLIVNAAPARPLPPAVVAQANPLVVNESEAAFYLGTATSEPGPALAEQLRSLGAVSVVVTLGAQGAFIVGASDAASESDAALIAAQPAAVTDTTGAGDCFVAAIAVELARGADLLDAVRFGIRAAAITVSRAGAQSSFPMRDEVES